MRHSTSSWVILVNPCHPLHDVSVVSSKWRWLPQAPGLDPPTAHCFALSEMRPLSECQHPAGRAAQPQFRAEMSQMIHKGHPEVMGSKAKKWMPSDAQHEQHVVMDWSHRASAKRRQCFGPVPSKPEEVAPRYFHVPILEVSKLPHTSLHNNASSNAVVRISRPAAARISPLL